MPKRKYTSAEIIALLREIEHLCIRGKTIEAAVKCVGISEQLYYRWREKHLWMTDSEYLRMKKLESENTRLKALIHFWLSFLEIPGYSLRTEEDAPRASSS